MIVFKKITWMYFLSTGQIPVEIELSKNNHTLIVGSNGSGKSTMLDALCFSLFGKAFRNITKPSLVNTLNNKELLVEIEFSIGPDEYKISRGIKPTIFEIYKNNVMLNQDAASRDYQKYLEETILKFSYKSFTQIVILGSASHTPFMQLTSYQRREIIEDLLNITIFSKMNVLMKEKNNQNEKELDKNSYEISRVQEAIKLTEGHIEKNNFDIEKRRADNLKDITEYRVIIDDINENINTLRDGTLSIDQVSSSFKELKKQVSFLINEKEKQESKVKILNKQTKFFEENDSCHTCTQPITIDIKTSIKEKNANRVSQIVEVVDRAETKINEMEVKIVSHEETINGFTKKLTEINKLNSDILLYEDRISNLMRQNQETFTDFSEENQTLNKYQEDLEVLINDKKRLLINQTQYSIASGLLKDNGIKAIIINKYIPVINTLINKYLSAMDFFVNFNLDETFNETIKSRFRDVFSYENFSEGEKQKIDIALLFTWRDVSRLNNSMSSNLLVMDEIFDSSLDINSTDDLTKIMFDLSKDVNLFVISHKTDILPDKFKNVIRFDKSKNFSRAI